MEEAKPIAISTHLLNNGIANYDDTKEQMAECAVEYSYSILMRFKGIGTPCGEGLVKCQLGRGTIALESTRVASVYISRSLIHCSRQAIVLNSKWSRTLEARREVKRENDIQCIIAL